MIVTLKKMLEDKVISAQELSEKTGLSKNVIWNYASGRNHPSPDALCRIADALDISIDELVREKEKTLSKERARDEAIIRLEQLDVAELREILAFAQYQLYRKEREQIEGQAASDKK